MLVKGKWAGLTLSLKVCLRLAVSLNNEEESKTDLKVVPTSSNYIVSIMMIMVIL